MTWVKQTILANKMTTKQKCFLAVLVGGSLAMSIYVFIKKCTFNTNVKSAVLRSGVWKKRLLTVVSTDDCTRAVNLLKISCEKVVGFDCEWVTIGNKRHPIALLQLATADGHCALFRLCKLKCIPNELKEVLEDSAILKIGVATADDAKYLLKDYGVEVRGCLDLRHLVGKSSGGLAGLCESFLNFILNKSKKVRCSDWEITELSQLQCEYAALDAIVAIEIFLQIFYSQIWFWEKNNSEKYENFITECKKYIDIKFKINNSGLQSGQKAMNNNHNSMQQYRKSKDYSRGISTRSRPLYDNCYLQAPDGEVLCTCDHNKAKWYVEKGLGDVVEENPYTVRLRFEPAGRAVGEVGSYYTQVKKNCCVVCGKTESYLRKNIIPHEYRKYFPIVMKDHTSHDVLLLCMDCHLLSSSKDYVLRHTLSIKCNAPMGSEENVKTFEIPELKKVRLSARALLRNAEQIPEARKDELKAIVLDYYKNGNRGLQLTKGLLEEASVLNSVIYNQKYEPHGYRVVEYFKLEENGGLITLERLWRQHFLDSMQPRFMPNLWSVEHNHHRLVLRAEQNRVLPVDLDIAGVNVSVN